MIMDTWYAPGEEQPLVAGARRKPSAAPLQDVPESPLAAGQGTSVGYRLSG